MAKVAFKAKKLPKGPQKNWPEWPQMTKDGKASPKVVKLVKLAKGVKKRLVPPPMGNFLPTWGSPPPPPCPMMPGGRPSLAVLATNPPLVGDKGKVLLHKEGGGAVYPLPTLGPR